MRLFLRRKRLKLFVFDLQLKSFRNDLKLLSEAIFDVR